MVCGSLIVFLNAPQSFLTNCTAALLSALVLFCRDSISLSGRRKTKCEPESLEVSLKVKVVPAVSPGRRPDGRLRDTKREVSVAKLKLRQIIVFADFCHRV